MQRCLTAVVSVGTGGEELLNHDTVRGVRARGCLVIVDDQIGISHRADGKGHTTGHELIRLVKTYVILNLINSHIYALQAENLLQFNSIHIELGV